MQMLTSMSTPPSRIGLVHHVTVRGHRENAEQNLPLHEVHESAHERVEVRVHFALAHGRQDADTQHEADESSLLWNTKTTQSRSGGAGIEDDFIVPVTWPMGERNEGDGAANNVRIRFALLVLPLPTCLGDRYGDSLETILQSDRYALSQMIVIKTA